MNNDFGITAERAADGVKDMSKLMNCDYETVWIKYTHQLIKDLFSWEDIKEYLKDN